MDPLNFAEKFWANVDIAGPDDCWPWLKSVGSHGYGQTWAPHLVEGRGVVPAPRVAFYLTYGRLPQVTRHRCPGGPNKLCCNGRHLVDGTDKDNAADRIADGNQRRGETNGNAVLTAELVREARAMRGAGMSVAAIARTKGVNYRTLMSALVGKSWGHL